MTDALLEVRDLKTKFYTDDGDRSRSRWRLLFNPSRRNLGNGWRVRLR